MVLTQLYAGAFQLLGEAGFPYHYGSYATFGVLVDNNRSILFPYHYGSYATKTLLLSIAFHSTVSIPLWFLRNEYQSFLLPSMFLLFPYHYGSYATHIWRHKIRSSSVVSIPLWFLRNLHGAQRKCLVNL